MTRAAADFLVENASNLYTVAGSGEPRRGAQLMDVGRVEDGALAARGGEIVAVGTTEEVRARVRLLPGCTVIDAEGHAVVPGFVDPHTHAVFGRARSEEFGRRLVGESYQSIAADGGGIRASVRDFRAIDEEELFDRSLRRVRQTLRYGTTTIEIKSGYGLDLENEMKALRVIDRLGRVPGLPTVVATCLAAHEFPDEWREDRDGYVREVCETILPAVREAGLAERVDVFCEPGVYTVEQSRRVLEAGHGLGMRSTVHADELEGQGGAALASEMGSDSADHLGAIDEAGIAALAGSDTVGVLLPGTIFALGLDNWAPARRMIEEGVVVALASDFNPGSNYCESIPLTIAIACTRLGLHPHQALSMATLNAAHALRRGDRVGSLEVGKRADCLVLREGTIDGLAHHLGLDPVEATVIAGQIAYRRLIRA